VLVWPSLGGFHGKIHTRAYSNNISVICPPFPGESRNTALTVMVATNVCVIGVIVAMDVKPPIDQRDSRPEGRSVTTRIQDWTGHFSF
jgi:hypothetical protein